MAATMVLPAKSGSRVLGKWLQRVARGSACTGVDAQKSNLNYSRLKRRCWTMKDTDPAVAAASYAAAPVQVGDPVYRIDSDEAFICAVAPAAATNASFININTSA